MIRVVAAGLGIHLEDTPDIEFVAQCASAREALGALIAHGPDVLVTGVRLPEMTGDELVAVARRNHPGVRVHVVGLAGDEDDLRRSVIDAISRSARTTR